MPIKLNGADVPVTLFPDGTSQVWKLDIPRATHLEIEWRFSHEGEFMHLAQLMTLLKRLGREATLRLPYLPYGRQDKAIENDATFALRTFADLINALDFHRVIIVDPHSDKFQWIDNAEAFFPTALANDVYEKIGATMLCYPDAGALEKYRRMYDQPYCYGQKTRDATTGDIVHYTVQGPVKDQTILIIDDICDGGATFILLTERLLKLGAKSVSLFVSHGLFTKGLDALFKSGLSRIFDTHGELTRGSILRVI